MERNKLPTAYEYLGETQAVARHLVCLTYDFDAVSGHAGQATTSLSPSPGPWGGQYGVDRILSLLDRERVRATFFAAGATLSENADVAKALVGDGHEIGHHGWDHRRPDKNDREAEEEELLRGIEAIDTLTGRTPNGYRSPSWGHSPHTVELLLANGFVYDSSLMCHDHRPYRARVTGEAPKVSADRDGAPTTLIEMPVNWSIDDYTRNEWAALPGGLATLGYKSSRDLLRGWQQDYATMADSEHWGVVVYTFHPFISGRGKRMLAMERLIRYLKANGADFVTMSEAADEARAHIDPIC
jgi:peptidoglycan/xylan/chitin deacetylase (PgdA/CDA1 family)